MRWKPEFMQWKPEFNPYKPWRNYAIFPAEFEFSIRGLKSISSYDLKSWWYTLGDRFRGMKPIGQNLSAIIGEQYKTKGTFATGIQSYGPLMVDWSKRRQQESVNLTTLSPRNSHPSLRGSR